MLPGCVEEKDSDCDGAEDAVGVVVTNDIETVLGAMLVPVLALTETE